MYPITNEVKALFEAEQRKVLRITGKPLKKNNVSVGPSDIVTVNDAAAIPAKDITIAIEPVQTGSGDPSPTNVRPISGWTGANVSSAGKNLYPVKIGADSWSNFNNGSATNNDGELVVSMASQMYSGVYSRAGLSEARKLATIPTVASYSAMIKASESTEIFFGYSRAGNRKIQLTTSYQRFTFNNFTFGNDQSLNIYNGTANAVTIYVKDFQFELGSTASAYEPYSGTTYDITFPSEAGTVYGGTLDVTTGLLTVTHGYVDLGTLTWTYIANRTRMNASSFSTYNPKIPYGTQIPNILCSQYKPYANDAGYSGSVNNAIMISPNGTLMVVDHRYTDVDAFKSAMSGVQLVYELATPQTYQLTPTEVTLLLGDNNVWADTGDMTLTYMPYADLIITDDNVIADSFQVDRYSCNGEKLEIGTAIAAQLTLTLENGNGTYDDIAFEGAELFVEVGIADWTQSSPTITYIPCGYFTPDEQPRRLSTISITALDRMTKFDVVVDAADLTFPTTIAGLVGQVCTLCGVTLAQSISGLVNAGVNVAELPTAQEEITYRNLIQWCAGIMATNAWFDWNGQLRFSWYANTTGYVSTTDNRYNSDMYEDDLTVSGVEYTNNSGIVIVEGTDDYAIDLTGNAIAGPLVATVLPPLNTALNGFTYRPFTAATVNAPYLWPMDIVTFTDKDGNDHTSALTNVAFGLNGTTALEAKGMTYAINKAAQPKGFTKEQAQLVNQAMDQVETNIDESLTQQEIFNRLTDNGAAQGLVLYNGQLYVNASYIQAGTLTLGGLNNVNGQLRVLDASGNEVGKWTKDGIETIKGTLGEWTIDSHGLSKSDSNTIYDWDVSVTPNGIIYESTHLPGIHDYVSKTLLDYSRIALNRRLGSLGWSNNEIYGEAEDSTGASVLKLIATGQGYGQNQTVLQMTSKDHSDGGTLTVNGNLKVGEFVVDTSGNVTSGARNQFDGDVDINGNISFFNPAAARASLEITPDNIGALANDHIYNGLDKSLAGYALDARQGTALNTRLSAVESKLSVSSGVFGVNSYTSVHAVGANYLIKFNNIVFGMLNMTFGTTQGSQIKIPINTSFAQAPVGFRPSSTITVPAMMQYNASSWAAYEVTIGSDGYIKQSWSSSMTGIYLSVVYSVA